MIISPPHTWAVWDLFFPPICAQCGRSLRPTDTWFCGQCWVNAPVVDPRKALKMPAVNMSRAGFQFHGENLVRRAVHALKYQGHTRIAAEMASRLLPRIPTHFVEHDVVWCPVPLHWTRNLIRGFNQSQILADRLSDLTGHAKAVSIIKRVRNTPSQTSKSLRARRENVKGAFAPSRKQEIPKKILLIDDVMTTGATVNECASVLKAAGAEWVGALAFALTEL